MSWDLWLIVIVVTFIVILSVIVDFLTAIGLEVESKSWSHYDDE